MTTHAREDEMPETEEIVNGYRVLALSDMQRASELFVRADTTGLDEDLKRAMLAHENAGQSTRHYFYVKGCAREEAISGPCNRLRMPQQNRTA